MGASQQSWETRATPAPERRFLTGSRTAGRARPVGRSFLRHPDVAPALVALIAVLYTGFSLIRSPAEAPHRESVARSANSLSPSGLGVPATGPTQASATQPSTTQPRDTEPTPGSSGAGQSGAPTAGTARTVTTSAAPPSRTPATSPHGDPPTGHSTGGGSADGSAPAPTRGASTPGVPWVPTPTSAATPKAPDVTDPQDVPPAPTASSLSVGSAISLRAMTGCCTARYLRHQSDAVVLSAITSSSTRSDKNDATWIVRPGLANSWCVSFESKNRPGTYLRHYGFRIYRHPVDDTAIFRADATFCPTEGKNGTGISFVSLNYPPKLLRRYHDVLYIAGNGEGGAEGSPDGWADDVSWDVMSAWAP